LPGIEDQQKHVLSLEEEVFGHGFGTSSEVQGIRARECGIEAYVCRFKFGSQDIKGCDRKKVIGPCQKRSIATELVEERSISIVRACNIMELDRSMFYYTSARDDSAVEEKLRWYAEHYPARGFPEYFKRIRKEGLKWNHKRVRRVYLKLGMNRRIKTKRRVSNSERHLLLQPLYPNITWSIDFMEDKLTNGRRFRTLNIIDDYNREALNIVVDYSFPSDKVVETIEQIIEWRGQPEEIRSDNGTEFTAKAFEGFCGKLGIRHLKSSKGKPMQNGYIERFNRTYREDVLNMHLFENIHQVKDLTEKFTEDYNLKHPHDGLADMTPIEFLNHRSQKIPTFAVGF